MNLKNKLVQYQGGGYDGCVWEWNFFYYDKQGKFIVIKATGRNGITNEQDAKDLIELDNPFICDLDSEQEVKQFCNENHPQTVIDLVQFFTDNPDLNYQFYGVCSLCEQECSDVDDLYAHNLDLICNDCHNAGLCDCCGEYEGQENIVCLSNGDFENDYQQKAAYQLIDDSHGYVCKDCLEWNTQGVIKDEQDDLVHSAFCTGKPELFSDEMRFFWGG